MPLNRIADDMRDVLAEVRAIRRRDSRRDRFALAALGGLIARGTGSVDDQAIAAYAYADALIAARGAPPDDDPP